MTQYCIFYINAGSGEMYLIKRNSAHDAFIDLIDVLDNPSNYNIQLRIENK